MRFLLIALTLGCPLVGYAEALSADGMREDIQVLSEVWSRTDRSLTAERRAKFDASLQQLLKRVPTLTGEDFALEISRTVAIARNGHSQAQIESRLHGLPIGFAWFADGVFIVRADAYHSGLLGARIERFGTLTVDDARARAGELISGSDAWVRQQSAVYLRTLEVLRFIGASRSSKEVSLLLSFPNGQMRRVSLRKAATPNPSPAPEWTGVVPAAPDTTQRWAYVLDAVPNRPSIYRNLSNLDREWWKKDQVFYLRSNYIYGSDTNRYELFDKLLGVLQVEVAERHPRFAIIDLRLNHGGDFFNTVSFAYALPKLIPADGKIFVLVGPDTFSAAIATAAMLKSQGGSRVIFVGETMGDDAEFWSEGPPVTLPHSGIVITSGTRKQNWASACSDSPDCYWGNVAFGPQGISLAPDIKVAARFADYAAG